MFCIELAALACADNFLRVAEGRGPVEALSEGFSDQSLWSYVVAAYSGVDVLQELLALSDMDTSLQNPGGTAMVELTLDEGEEFCAACETPSLFLAFGQFATLEAVPKRDLPVGRRGSWCRDGVDLHQVLAWFFG